MERDASLKRRALEFISGRSDEYLRLSIARIYESFSRETIGVV